MQRFYFYCVQALRIKISLFYSYTVLLSTLHSTYTVLYSIQHRPRINVPRKQKPNNPIPFFFPFSCPPPLFSPAYLQRPSPYRCSSLLSKSRPRPLKSSPDFAFFLPVLTSFSSVRFTTRHHTNHPHTWQLDSHLDRCRVRALSLQTSN